MSLQDDYFDLSDALEKQKKKNPELSEMFDRIWGRFCENEAELLELREFKCAVTRVLKDLSKEFPKDN